MSRSVTIWDLINAVDSPPRDEVAAANEIEFDGEDPDDVEPLRNDRWRYPSDTNVLTTTVLSNFAYIDRLWVVAELSGTVQCLSFAKAQGVTVVGSVGVLWPG